MGTFVKKLNCRYVLYSFFCHTAKLWSDKFFLSAIFPLRVGYKLNIKNPTTYNEKLQWLKLYYRKPIMSTMVDKIEAKNYVSKIIGSEFIIPTIAIYSSVDEIDWDKLPKQFVLKCTHDSGGIVVCKNKDNLNIEVAKKKLRAGLKTSYYALNREWPYKNVIPRIIAEHYMEDESGYELKDYKWFCFDGEPKALFIASDRQVKGEETKFDFFDADFNHLPFTNGHPNTSKEIKKPAGFETMKKLAAQLSKGFPHLRVDFYDINGKVYFGELTFYHWSGMKPFIPRDWDYKFGEMISLPKEN